MGDHVRLHVAGGAERERTNRTAERPLPGVNPAVHLEGRFAGKLGLALRLGTEQYLATFFVRFPVCLEDRLQGEGLWAAITLEGAIPGVGADVSAEVDRLLEGLLAGLAGVALFAVDETFREEVLLGYVGEFFVFCFGFWFRRWFWGVGLVEHFLLDYFALGEDVHLLGRDFLDDFDNVLVLR